ncbi:hypothetical protein CCMSSC00406_0006799 [Pleurotus cornucopiae]|uniref:Uncharacterized protein n=1 Tax=Pleurotus cornucopiae TaxID=5321 RepID=A0ACB7J2H9_PLECO|nr:hypothetical protein CCMSSC00406_0006799 [Pleurotus cornucopiae]
MPPGPSFNTFANYKFSIDGDIVGEYTHEAERRPDYLYGTPVYVNTSLENAYHNFSIIMDSTKRSVLILFDYAVYTMIGVNLVNLSASVPNQPTFPSEVTNMPSAGTTVGNTSGTPSTSPSDQPTAPPDVTNRSRISSSAVVGSTLGAVTFLFCVGLVCLVVCRRRRTLGVQSGERAATITHNPLLVLDPNTQALPRMPRDEGPRLFDAAIRELRQMIQDIHADQRAMRTALRMPSSHAA